MKKYIRKTSRASWDEDAMILAMEEAKLGSVKAAAKKYGISLTTLQRHIKTGCPKKKLGRYTSIFTKNQEKELIELCHTDNLDGLTRKEFLKIVYHYAKAKNICNPFKNGCAGVEWYKGFKTRHPVDFIHTKRKASSNKVEMFCQLLEEKMTLEANVERKVDEIDSETDEERSNLEYEKRRLLPNSRWDKKQVLCALLFYAQGSYQRITGKAHHFSQEAMSVYIEEVTTALNHPNIMKRFINFPTTRQERDGIKQSFFNKYGIPGVIGSIDGSHFKIFTPQKEEEHLYYCRKHYHSMNVQMICDHNCKILSINAKFGGATHDSFIWENSDINNYIQSLHRRNEFVWLLGDSGYPQRPWLMTPYLNPTPNSIEPIFNAAHTSARVVIENTFGRLKNRWRCIHRDRTLHYRPEKCSQIIVACSVLHNIALKYNVPDPEETCEQEEQEFRREEVVLEDGRR